MASGQGSSRVLPTAARFICCLWHGDCVGLCFPWVLLLFLCQLLSIALELSCWICSLLAHADIHNPLQCWGATLKLIDGGKKNNTQTTKNQTSILVFCVSHVLILWNFSMWMCMIYYIYVNNCIYICVSIYYIKLYIQYIYITYLSICFSYCLDTHGVRPFFTDQEFTFASLSRLLRFFSRGYGLLFCWDAVKLHVNGYCANDLENSQR